MGLSVRRDATPNPNAMKFTAAEQLFENRLIAKAGDSVENKLASELLAIDGVDNIFGYDDFVTVNKTVDASWDELLPKIEAIFQNS